MDSIQSTTEPVHVDLSDGVLRIRLNRPDFGNALNLDVARALATACSSIAETNDLGAVLLESEGSNFCLGGDVTYFARPDRASTDGVGELVSTLHAAIKVLDEAPVPVVSAIQGWCVGAGLGLGLIADVVLCAETARFRSAYTAIGFTPDLGASWQLPRLMGRARSQDFILSNRILDAASAWRCGLVSDVVPAAELTARSLAYAQAMADGPRMAHRSVRELTRADERTAFFRRLDQEARTVTAASESPEGKEGVRAFLSRTPAPSVPPVA